MLWKALAVGNGIMKLIRGNIWEANNSHICITTNNVVNSVGSAVWGKGIAKQAKDRWPNLPRKHAVFLKNYGHIFGRLFDEQFKNHKVSIYTFPTKYHWKDPSDIDLICRSARQMREFTKTSDTPIPIALPAPGCGNGGLDFDIVMEKLEPILIEDYFHIYCL